MSLHLKSAYHLGPHIDPRKRRAEVQVDEVDLFTLGPHFQQHEAFPARTNTEFVEACLAAAPAFS